MSNSGKRSPSNPPPRRGRSPPHGPPGASRVTRHRPLAATFLGMELFGAGNGLYIATACLIAYRCSGSKGIYTAQRLP